MRSTSAVQASQLGPRKLDAAPTRRQRALRRLREVPLLPSLVTLGNVACGFLALAKIADALRMTQPQAPFSAVVALFATAATLVFVAMVCDALDGRVARMTNQATPFGAQLDSMADMVTFGVVPAFLGKVLVDWHAQADGGGMLAMHPKWYFAAAAVYVLCAAMRLARFNVETGSDEADHREFRGLPSPAAAAVVCSLVLLFCTKESADSLGHAWLPAWFYAGLVRAMPWLLGVLGLLMVSRIPYPHAMSYLLRKGHSLAVLGLAALVVVLAAVEWELALAVLAVGYLLVGTGLGLCKRLFRRERDDDLDSQDEQADLADQ